MYEQAITVGVISGIAAVIIFVLWLVVMLRIGRRKKK